MHEQTIDRTASVIIERDASGWHRQVEVWSEDEARHAAAAQTSAAAQVWDRVLAARAPLEGVRVRATGLERTIANEYLAVSQRATTTSIVARLHGADGTFVVVRRSIAHDVAPFTRARDVDAEVDAFADDAAFVKASSSWTAHGDVLLSGAAAGTLLHEAIGHTHEADNAAQFGAVAAEDLPTGLAVVDLGEVPGSDQPRLDDRLRRMTPATVLSDDGPGTSLGGEIQGTTSLHAARARRLHRDAPYLARMTHLVARPTTLLALDDERYDVEVDNVVAAFVDLRGKRVTLHLGSSRVRRGGSMRRAHGGRIDLDIAELRTRLRGHAGPAATEVAMCDKRGQRLPVATTCPPLALRGVSVRDVVI